MRQTHREVQLAGDAIQLRPQLPLRRHRQRAAAHQLPAGCQPASVLCTMQWAGALRRYIEEGLLPQLGRGVGAEAVHGGAGVWPSMRRYFITKQHWSEQAVVPDLVPAAPLARRRNGAARLAAAAARGPGPAGAAEGRYRKLVRIICCAADPQGQWCGTAVIALTAQKKGQPPFCRGRQTAMHGITMHFGSPAAGW